MEHLGHFTRNNVEDKKIITISLNDSFRRADHRHVSGSQPGLILLHSQFIPLHPKVFWPLHSIKQQLTTLGCANSPCDGSLEQEWSGRPAPLGSICHQTRLGRASHSSLPHTLFFFPVFWSCLLVGQKLEVAQGGLFCLTGSPREKSLPC